MKLTSLSHGAGCGCKIGAAELRGVAGALSAPVDPAVMVGFETSDDAAAYRLTDELAIVQTVDFFTPIVDDPYDFGRIAATNALSDVYAMGARPITALNVVAFSLEQLGPEILAEILRGGQAAVSAAGASIVGGHSIDDPEPKYGLAVTGRGGARRIADQRRWTGGRRARALQARRRGVVSTAGKRGLADEALLQRALDVMTELNR